MLECNCCPAGRQDCYPSSTAQTCASHRWSQLSPSTPRVTLFTASPWGLTHLHTFCLATQYLQGKGRKYYFFKRKKKKKSEGLKSGSPHRARCCPVTHTPPHPVFLRTKQQAQPEKAMAPHSSTLAWKIPWTEGPGGLQSMESLGVGHD